MGATTQTSTSSTAPANPDVNNTISKLAKGIGDQVVPGASLFTPPGSNTTGGQSASLTAANNPIYSQGVNGALGDFADVAAGNRFGMNDPGYAALRSKLSNDVLTQTNQSFNNSGLFGSDSNQRAASEGLGNALAGLDYGNYQQDIARQQQAAGMLPGLFSAAQLPSSVQQSVGASQDAASAAQAAGPTDFLAKLSAIAAGNAQAGGQTQTNTSPGTPLWQTLLGGAIGGAGLLAR
jgi:hypothetical protein